MQGRCRGFRLLNAHVILEHPGLTPAWRGAQAVDSCIGACSRVVEVHALLCAVKRHLLLL